ncbi:ORMDL family protein [Hibiscus syriacus]|uniref:ORMDL family protein n=1 Tax=Hibiscus syriacus TaxID=106335 RepID=A0A6A3AU39_HIBSY|nr:ORMDL family protein [Hibiscus syriacus]
MVNDEGRPECFYSHSSVLPSKSSFFVDQLSNTDFRSCIEIQCLDTTYVHHVNLLKSFHLPTDSLLDSLDSVQSVLGILHLAVAFRCEAVTNCCLQYLEAVPWDNKEEEQVIKEFALPHKSVDLVHLLEMSLRHLCKNKWISCLEEMKKPYLEWMCNILPKMDLMKDFVCRWGEMSGKVLGIIEDNKLDNAMWGLKLKLIEVTGKVLEAVGYGNMILPAPCWVQLLKTWIRYIRKIKPLLAAEGDKDTNFPYKMDEDLCQSIEGAIFSLPLALPSNDQINILSDWMETEQIKYPDLSEAFEIWCYRTKSAKRRLMEGLDRAGNTTISL